MKPIRVFYLVRDAALSISGGALLVYEGFKDADPQWSVVTVAMILIGSAGWLVTGRIFGTTNTDYSKDQDDNG